MYNLKEKDSHTWIHLESLVESKTSFWLLISVNIDLIQSLKHVSYFWL